MNEQEERIAQASIARRLVDSGWSKAEVELMHGDFAAQGYTEAEMNEIFTPRSTDVGKSVVLDIAGTFDNNYSLPNTKKAVRDSIENGAVGFSEIRAAAISILSGGNVVQAVEPKGLRWKQADNGDPVTWSWNFKGTINGIKNNRLYSRAKKQIKKIEDACGVTFEEVDGESNIEIGFEGIDGQGNILGFVNSPRNGDDMRSCSVCGDVHLDVAEPFQINDYSNVLLHELAHGMGIPHNETDNESIMFPSYRFGSKENDLDAWTIEELNRRYPK